jgi:hypothetical protein
MSQTEQIDMIRRHIAEAERHVASQREVVRKLQRLGADTLLAEDILEEFETTLAQHHAHLAQALQQ